MAQLYGKASEYLLSQRLKNKYTAFWIFCWIIPCFIIYFILGFYYRFGWNFVLIWVPLFLLVCVFLDKISWIFIRKAYKFKKGIYGENLVLRELLKLSDDYLIFRNIRLPERKEDIDFILLCPSGIYILETKNIKGGLVLDKAHREGRRIIAQVTGQFWGLRDYIKRTTNLDIFVHPLIVYVQKDYSSKQENKTIEDYITLINHRDIQGYFSSRVNLDQHYHNPSLKKQLEYLSTQ